MIDYRRKTVIKGQQELRCGYTTGTCAAAAAKAAAVTLLSGEICRDVSLQLPGGEHIILETEFLECSENCVKCGMIKDAGDDPDITNGLLICAAVEKTEGKTILIDGGMGVGRVTKPGLDQPVGAAAINSVPRKMIHEAVEDVRRQYAWEKGLKVTVFIPNGKEKAEKTLNPMLGIVGGLSVLGTTGIVEPMSEKALIDTIAVDIRMHRAQNEDILLMAPGNYGLDFLKNTYHYDLDKSVKCSNFIGDTIDMAVENGFEAMLLTGHIGKLIKVAGGIMNTHSQEGDCRMELITSSALSAGADADTARQILSCVTTEEAVNVLKKAGLCEKTMELIMQKIMFYLNKRAAGKIAVACILYSNEHGGLGESAGAAELLARLKEEKR